MAEAEGFWVRTATTSISAVSEALFPTNDLGAPDWKDTALVPRTRAYLDELPDEQRRLVTLLFIVVELASPLLTLTFRRFSKLKPERRTLAVQRWRRHWFQPFTWLGDALKATMTMIYMSHPLVIAHIEGFKTCEREADPLNFRIDKDALKRLPVVS